MCETVGHVFIAEPMAWSGAERGRAGYRQMENRTLKILGIKKFPMKE